MGFHKNTNSTGLGYIGDILANFHTCLWTHGLHCHFGIHPLLTITSTVASQKPKTPYIAPALIPSKQKLKELHNTYPHSKGLACEGHPVVKASWSPIARPRPAKNQDGTLAHLPKPTHLSTNSINQRHFLSNGKIHCAMSPSRPHVTVQWLTHQRNSHYVIKAKFYLSIYIVGEQRPIDKRIAMKLATPRPRSMADHLELLTNQRKV